MKNKNCLSELDLTLHYYGELATDGEQFRHLADCAFCTERFAALGRDLAGLPDPLNEPDELAGTRMAARVNERLKRKRRNWAPALGVSTVAVFALVATIATLSPTKEPMQAPQDFTQQVTTANISEEMPDIDFLEELELLKELDLLSQLEGV